MRFNRRFLRALALAMVLALLCPAMPALHAHAAQKNCTMCGGSGKMPCTSCTGGRIRCAVCGGLGMKTTTTMVQVTTYTTSFSPFGGSTMIPTTRYETRTQQVPCGSCSGGYTMCYSCNGTGRKNCPGCGGTGKVNSGSSSSGSSSSGSSSSGSSGSDAKTGKDDPDVPFEMAHGTVLAGTDSNYNDEGVQYLFDGDRNTKYCTVTTAVYFIWKSPKPIRVSGYQIMTGNDNTRYNGRNPKSWTLYGSTKQLDRNSDGWKKIHAVANDTVLEDKDYETYTFKWDAEAPAYQFFKFESTENCGDGCTQMSEFTLLGTETDAMEEEPAAEPEAPATATVKGLKYALDAKAGTATFTGPTSKTVKSITIPATIQVKGVAYKVTAVKASAGKGLKKLTTLSLGKNVATLGTSAFSGCTALKTVKGGKGLATIGQTAFKGDVALTKFTFYDKVKTIKQGAFDGCKKLATFVFKTKLLTAASVGANAFRNTGAKPAVTCPKDKKKAYSALLPKKGMSKKAKY